MDALRTTGAIILVLLVVVIVHEMGHYLVAKRSGIQVDEFAVGFGPKLFWLRRGETVYALRALPAGGFVRLAGMTGLPEEKDPGPRAFWRASIPRRTATILAGGIFNLVFAALVFGVQNLPSQASQVVAHSPMAAAGVPDGSQLVRVAGRDVPQDSQEKVMDLLHQVVEDTKGQPVQVVYRDPQGTVRTTTVTPYLALYNTTANTKLPLAIAVDAVNGTPVHPGDPVALFDNGGTVTVSGHDPGDPSVRYTDLTVKGVEDAPITPQTRIGKYMAGWRFGYVPGYPGMSLLPALGNGFTQVPSTIATTFTTLYAVITTPDSGGLAHNLSGPVGIVRQTGDVAQHGWWDLLGWIGFLSLNLGLFNLLPIPFLDGGRFVFIVLEAIRRRRVDPRREAAIHYVGLMLILALVFYVTFTGDITRGRS